MFSDLPFGGSLRSALAYSRPLAAGQLVAFGPEFGGFWIEDSLAKVTIASATRITAAATVQPTSRRVLPRICAGDGALARAEAGSARRAARPRRATKITSAMYSVDLVEAVDLVRVRRAARLRREERERVSEQVAQGGGDSIQARTGRA